MYIKTQTGNHIKIARSDRGGEFLSKEMIKHQDEKGTVRELTIHGSPPQNGTAELGIRTQAEPVRALLLASGLPRYLWEEVMHHSVWLQNWTPACALNGKTSYEERHKKNPHLAGIQEFGVAVYVKNLTACKLDSTARLGCFVRYHSESKGYRIYWPDKQSITVERNIIFNESDVLSTDTTALIPGDALDEGEKE